MTNVQEVLPDYPLNIKFSGKSEDIKKETNWNNISVRQNTYSSFSLISQGKYDDKLISQYDDTYYYPKSGGSGVYTFVIERGFNFNTSDFQGRGKCYIYIKEGKIYKYKDGTYACYNSEVRGKTTMEANHGTKVAQIIGGKNYGAAPNVNILGVVLETSRMGDFLHLLHVIRNFETPKTKIINISFSFEMNPNKLDIYYYHFEDIVHLMGVNHIFVTPAGNENRKVVSSELINAPCNFENVICVGGVDNDINGLKTMKTQNYKRWAYSNYGKEVNIYAPACFYFYYKNYYNEIISEKICGTSYSTALVSGVLATRISELKDNKQFSDYIKDTDIGIKNIISNIPSGSNNLFLNNGKRIVYSKNNVYNSNGCGPNVGNQSCPTGSCCSEYGYCGTSNDHCKVGCQRQFGTCK